ncbi:MAG: DEAD/DEAH box helicase [Dehalococcoidales bacterium]|nr:DEAD/DEAH box helicase [Dehalococcoidales bacterium]
MDTSGFIHYLTTQPGYSGQISHVESIAPRKVHQGELEHPLVKSLEECLEANSLWPLYSHQAEAVNYVRRGSNVMIATSSASGKSMCYNIPVAESLLTEKSSRALYLFPTKALAQDQLRSLRAQFCPELFSFQHFDTFDGDTPHAERSEIKQSARILITNPDMLHIGILPNHQSWSRLLRRLRYVVVDEAHLYRGVFGSHVACVLRRLRRLCEIYGTKPQFICCSATIANPGEHAEKLTGLPFQVVDIDGAPSGGRDFVFWNPPLLDEKKESRRSANSEATYIFTELVQKEIRTLTFTRTRRLTELIYNYSRQRLAQIDHPLSLQIKPYRAGYLAEDRRRIEKDLFTGKLIGVVATTALEVGIDIGDLEATVLTGYPGSISGTWQQAGRSGRGKQKALSFLIAMDNPLDQYFMRHPEDFFRKSFENALINPANPYILRSHLACAAWELPLSDRDIAYFGSDLQPETMQMEQVGLLRRRSGKWYFPPGLSYPAQSVNIRSTSGRNYAIINTKDDALLETIESAMAFYQVHPGAIYLHQGDTYLVSNLDLESRTAYVEPADVNYYTRTTELSDLRIVKETHRRQYGQVTVCLGEVEVNSSVIGYRKKAQLTEEIIGEEVLDLPPQIFNTVSLWFDLPPAAVERISKSGLDFPGGIHAVEHAAISILPLFALCDRNDIGGVSTPFHPDTGKAQIFIYDAHPGGIGIAEKGYEMINELWKATFRAIAECPCQEGCPSCIQSPKCGNNNEPLDKKAAIIILEEVLPEGLK